jgi:hypothetical protein
MKFRFSFLQKMFELTMIQFLLSYESVDRSYDVYNACPAQNSTAVDLLTLCSLLQSKAQTFLALLH